MKANSMYFVLIAALFLPVIASAQITTDVAGCTAAQFVQGAATNHITTAGMTFTPKCLRVKLGSSVTIDGSSHHPLASMSDIGGARNPFATGSSFNTPQTRVMNTAGAFGYFCNVHGNPDGSGMAGVIIVE